MYIWLLISCIKTCTVKDKSNCRPFLDFHHDCEATCAMTAFLLIWLTVCSQNVVSDRKYLEFLNLKREKPIWLQLDCFFKLTAAWLYVGYMWSHTKVKNWKNYSPPAVSSKQPNWSYEPGKLQSKESQKKELLKHC